MLIFFLCQVLSLVAVPKLRSLRSRNLRYLSKVNIYIIYLSNILICKLKPIKEKKRKRRIIESDNEEEEEIKEKKSKIKLEDTEMKDVETKKPETKQENNEDNVNLKIENMEIASQPTDDAFDKEIEEANAEEKEVKKEKQEMMSIIHTM